MFRISLREMLVLVAAIAFAIVSLRYASPFLQAVIGLMAILALGATIIAGIFERGPERAFAIGFTIMMLAYWLLIVNGNKEASAPPGYTNNVELVGGEYARLPTTVLLNYLQKILDHSKYFDETTGKEIFNVNPDKDIVQSNATSNMPTIGGKPFISIEQPPTENFIPIGHYWWALLLSYVGGRYARFIYIRRIKTIPQPDQKNVPPLTS